MPMLAPTINTPINVNVNRIKLSKGWWRLAVVVSTWWSLWWTRWIIQRGLILCSNQWGRYAPIRSRNKIPKKTLNDQKKNYVVSDFQKSERDFAFIVNKEVSSQDLINAISVVDSKLISNIKVFDIYEGENIPENQKSIAISVTIQSFEKTLNDNDLEKINKLIVETVENKTGAKIRS